MDPLLRAKGQESACQATVQSAVGGTGDITHATANAHTNCELSANVETMHVGPDVTDTKSRPLWKSIHKQSVYKDCPAYMDGMSESSSRVGLYSPPDPYVTDEDMAYIMDCMKRNICCN